MEGPHLKPQLGSHLRLVPPTALPTEDDLALVRALNDPSSRGAAAQAVVRRYGPMVHRILKRSLGPGADVQDVTQEVFLRLFRRVPTLNDPQAFKQFVISITINVLKWELRRREVRRIVGLQPAFDDVAGFSEGVDPDAREALRRFDDILKKLSSHERALFVLRHMEELSLPEVASATNVSLATAKRHLDKVWKRITLAVAKDPCLMRYLPAPVGDEKVDRHE